MKDKNALPSSIKDDRAVLSVIGKDRVGIIAEVTGLLSEYGINVQDISQTIIQGIFTMIMLIDLEKSEIDITGLREKLSKLASDMGLDIAVQHTAVYEQMHRI